jgi:hypothetical protein
MQSAGTTIVLTLGPAAITGMVGFAVARTQIGIARAQVAAERDRMLLEHAEVGRQSRRAAYHELLTLLYRLDMLVGGFGPEVFADATFKRWADELMELCSRIELAAEVPVRSALRDVRRLIDAVGLAAVKGQDSRPFAERFAIAYRAQRGALDATIGVLLSVMQVDLQPATGAAARPAAAQTASGQPR